ncbi:phytoene/squalene synthase family protein [Planococcus sp. N064]|uniref:Phytoene/squalene synthase family protein n=1 Tax=Planococcus liqunii TaxID=3058394 RepID=A0ABT8MSA7_9BACL|nr:phytoene/squalene synthase family protein [Planococcus sp. N064]MDN7227724.1 phytoene/squalene synthase family protein [Planococcus sp. N064]
MIEIREAYNRCEEIIAANSKSFYKAFSLLPKEKRKAVWAVYAFCRTVDDIVDEGTNPVLELEGFKRSFQQFLAGFYDRDNAMWVALADVFENFQMDEEAFHSLIKGQEMDLVVSRYETLDGLMDYCYHVASCVGLMLLPILAPGKTAVLQEGAVSLGYAMQITNILRDIGQDLKIGRIYLPKEIMQKHGLTETDLQEANVNAAFVSVWEELAGEAERHYRHSFETVHEYPLQSRMAVKGAGLVYREILSAIRDKEYMVFREKHYVSEQSKQAILACL